ncbi:lysophospholipid acyltransferase family protein [Aquihabitans sp. McL0605]|uniref:lysophospholipid acyltransferase family protein n=1 Tax=Aquihabitans sp. McL0605 TaxID=3415671 RepID=UPI003CEC8B4A
MATDEVGKLYPVAKAILTPLFRAGWRFDLQGLENIPASGGAILCPNHTSVLDSFFVPALLPRRVSYVGKAEYMDDWKTRKLFPALGMIPIDREGGDAGERALATAQRLLEQGQLFGIYPEGTRSRDGRLYRGHTGPARLALRTGAPIIPIGITGAREVMPPEAKFPTLRLPVTIRFGKPITVDRYQDRGQDRMVLRQIIDEVMYEIRELSGQEYVDEYANKKKHAAAPAPAEATPAPAAPDAGTAAAEAPTAVNGSAPVGANGSSNGHGAVAEPAAAPGAEPAGESRPDDSAFVESTTPRSSADALKRPIRRSPV